MASQLRLHQLLQQADHKVAGPKSQFLCNIGVSEGQVVDNRVQHCGKYKEAQSSTLVIVPAGPWQQRANDQLEGPSMQFVPEPAPKAAHGVGSANATKQLRPFFRAIP